MCLCVGSYKFWVPKKKNQISNSFLISTKSYEQNPPIKIDSTKTALQFFKGAKLSEKGLALKLEYIATHNAKEKLDMLPFQGSIKKIIFSN